MKRDVYSKLLQWKDSTDRKPLILNGARQVGKTYILKTFGAEEFRNTVYFNLDKDIAAKAVIEKDYDTSRIISELSMLSGQDIVPGETLLVIDEIQESGKVLGLLKYFQEDAPYYHVAVAGSLLGISLHSEVSFPVGKVNLLDMHPMSFREFLTAKGEDRLVRGMEARQWSSVNTLSMRLEHLLMEYLFTGGMPEVVNAHISGAGPNTVREKQREILAGYANDFSKHAPKREVPRIHMIWESIPSQLFRESSHRFRYGDVRKGGRASEYEMALEWLVNSGLTSKVPRVNVVRLPLSFYSQSTVFKLLPLDTGLFGAMSDVPLSRYVDFRSLGDEYRGAIAEVYVNQQLLCADIKPYYYSREDSKGEIEFIIQAGEKVYPLEVKSGRDTQAATFKNLLIKQPELYGIRTSMMNYQENINMVNVPLYGIGSYVSSLSAQKKYEEKTPETVLFAGMAFSSPDRILPSLRSVRDTLKGAYNHALIYGETNIPDLENTFTASLRRASSGQSTDVSVLQALPGEERKEVMQTLLDCAALHGKLLLMSDPATGMSEILKEKREYGTRYRAEKVSLFCSMLDRHFPSYAPFSPKDISLQYDPGEVFKFVLPGVIEFSCFDRTGVLWGPFKSNIQGQFKITSPDGTFQGTLNIANGSLTPPSNPSEKKHFIGHEEKEISEKPLAGKRLK